jgi:plasmid rolling circle replication initiator protein Rep
MQIIFEILALLITLIVLGFALCVFCSAIVLFHVITRYPKKLWWKQWKSRIKSLYNSNIHIEF